MKTLLLTALLLSSLIFVGCGDDDNHGPSGGQDPTDPGNMPELSDFYISADLDGDSLHWGVADGSHSYIAQSAGTVNDQCTPIYGFQISNNFGNGWTDLSVALEFRYDQSLVDGDCDNREAIFDDLFEEGTYPWRIFYDFTSINETGAFIDYRAADGTNYGSTGMDQDNSNFTITEVQTLSSEIDPPLIDESAGVVAVKGTFNCQLVNDDDENDIIVLNNGSFYICMQTD